MTLRNEQIYLQYLQLGKDRTIKQLSEITGLTVDNLYKVSSRNNWKERIRLDELALKENNLESDTSNLGTGEILSAISRESLDKLHRVIKTVKVSNVRDAKTLLELSQLAAGKPTEITQSNSPSESTTNLIPIIRATLPKEYADKLIGELDRHAAQALFGNEQTPQV